MGTIHATTPRPSEMGPEQVAEVALETADPRTLIDALLRLTHKIHGTEDREARADLRRQRRLVEAEVHRRMLRGAR